MPYLVPGRSIAKRHPADIHHDEQVARAVSFSVHIRRSPHEAFTETAGTMAEAKTIAARLTAEHGKFGRRAMIYAITPEGASFPV